MFRQLIQANCFQGRYRVRGNCSRNPARLATRKENVVQNIFQILQHETSGDIPTVGFGRIPSLNCRQLLSGLRIEFDILTAFLNRWFARLPR